MPRVTYQGTDSFSFVLLSGDTIGVRSSVNSALTFNLYVLIYVIISLDTENLGKIVYVQH